MYDGCLRSRHDAVSVFRRGRPHGHQDVAEHVQDVSVQREGSSEADRSSQGFPRYTGDFLQVRHERAQDQSDPATRHDLSVSGEIVRHRGRYFRYER